MLQLFFFVNKTLLFLIEFHCRKERVWFKQSDDSHNVSLIYVKINTKKIEENLIINLLI